MGKRQLMQDADAVKLERGRYGMYVDMYVEAVEGVAEVRKQPCDAPGRTTTRTRNK